VNDEHMKEARDLYLAWMNDRYIDRDEMVARIAAALSQASSRGEQRGRQQGRELALHLKGVLSTLVHTAPGYDWNADPAGLTRVTGEAFEVIERALSPHAPPPALPAEAVEKLVEAAQWVRMNSGVAADGNHIDAMQAHAENCEQLDEALAAVRATGHK
jgi:uncharacterized alpha-E superfamily protein